MNIRILLSLLMVCCLIFSCKKEENKQGTVEFDLDGLHYSFIPAYVGLQPVSPRKLLLIESPNQGQPFFLRIAVSDEGDSMLNSLCMRPITFPSTDCRCGAQIMYSDTLSCVYDTRYDTANVASVEIISCSGNPPVLNATFNATIQSGRWDTSCLHQKLITNGRITNVIYPWDL
jgi:hypothetical protein